MARSKKHTMRIPEAPSGLWKVFEFAMGPGLMLAVLVALGGYLVISDQADTFGFQAAFQQAPRR